MTRITFIVALAGLIVGLLVGYLSWGTVPRPSPVADEARQKTERQLDEAQARASKAQDEVKALQGRLQALEADLAREKQQRSRLEMVVSEGKK